MSKNGILIVVSGFSGSGKGTLMQELMKKYDNYALSISAATREPREGEKDGVHYFFKSIEEFEKMIAEDELIEYARYVNNYYGTPKKYVEDHLAAGKDVILEIEIQGALKIKSKFPDALLLFVTPPDAATLERRLVGRGTETEDVIASRMRRAVEEADGMSAYDYIIVNDDIERCRDEVHQIIQSEHARGFRNKEFMNQIKAELKAISKGE